MSKSHVIDMTDKIVLITGGSRGLGRAMALGFADAGADLVIASRRLEACKEVCRAVEERGRRAMPYACHVGRWQECDALADAAYARFGKVDVLINNAGKSPLYDRPVDISEELYDTVLDLNLKGPFRFQHSVCGAFVVACLNHGQCAVETQKPSDAELETHLDQHIMAHLI